MKSGERWFYLFGSPAAIAKTKIQNKVVKMTEEAL
jgi:hypothetical protein